MRTLRKPCRGVDRPLRASTVDNSTYHAYNLRLRRCSRDERSHSLHYRSLPHRKRHGYQILLQYPGCTTPDRQVILRPMVEATCMADMLHQQHGAALRSNDALSAEGRGANMEQQEVCSTSTERKTQVDADNQLDLPPHNSALHDPPPARHPPDPPPAHWRRRQPSPCRTHKHYLRHPCAVPRCHTVHLPLSPVCFYVG